MSVFVTPKNNRRVVSLMETTTSMSTESEIVTTSFQRRVTRSASSTSTRIYASAREESDTPPKSAGKRKKEDVEDSATPSPAKRRRSPRGTATSTGEEMATASAVPVTPDGSTGDVTIQKIKRRTVSKKKVSVKVSTESTTPVKQKKSPPQGWKEIYTLVEELRQDRTAPCDGDGAEALPEKNLDPKVFRFQTLIALMLSSQTKDAMVGQAMRRLQQHGLTVENLHPDRTSAETLKGLIHGVGFHNNKTKYIHQVVQILLDKYDGDIPPTAAEMIKELPGVGPKMAYIVESICWESQTGIGVDTHMHRLFPLVGYVSKSVKNPEQTRQELEEWLPQEYWKDVNLLWVGFGQEVQQEKSKMLRKAIDCSLPHEALKLLQRCGMDVRTQGAKCGWTEEINEIFASARKNNV